MAGTDERIGRFIVLEGLDGSGKSTAAKAIARRLGAVCIHTPPGPFNAIRSDIDFNADLETRFFFYLSSVGFASSMAQKLLQQGDVVCDRYLASTVAYHAVMGVSLARQIRPETFLRPDISIFLSVSDEAERRRRIALRGHRTAADGLTDDDSFRDRLLREFSEFEMEVVETTGRSPDEVVDAALKLISAKTPRTA